MLRKSLFVVALICVLAIGTASVALADPSSILEQATPVAPAARPGPGPVTVTVAGSVTDLLADGFNMRGMGRQFRVIVTAETQFVINGVESPTLSDVVVDDDAVVTGTVQVSPDAKGTTEITATNVTIVRPENRPIRVTGEVQNKGDAGFEVAEEDGDIYAIVVDESTHYQISGVEGPSLADVQNGDQAVVAGWLQSSGSTPNQVLAELVVIRRSSLATRVEGQVTELLTTAGGFKLMDEQDVEWTIMVNSETEFVISGVEDPALEDVRVGDQAVVNGQQSSTEANSITAALVAIRREMTTVAGEVTLLLDNAAGFQLTTEDDVVWNIYTDDSTVFEIPGVVTPTLADVAVGNIASVRGELSTTEANAVLANRVTIRFQMMRLEGEVTGLLSASAGFTLTLSDGTEWTILVGEDTQYRITGIDEPSLADIVVGDKAIVVGPLPNAAVQTLTANRVEIARTLLRISGEITEILDNGFVLSATHSSEIDNIEASNPVEWTVLVTDDTQIKVCGVMTATLADLQVGDEAIVTGQPPEGGSTTITAKMVVVECQPFEVVGQVTEVLSDGFKLATKQDPTIIWTILVDENTKFNIPHDSDPGLDDVRPGDMAVAATNEEPAEGTLTFTATVVVIHHPKPVTLTGTVASIDETSFELDLGEGELKTINTDDDTDWVITGIKHPTIANLMVGAQASVTGNEADDGSLLASRVIARNPRQMVMKNVLGEITAVGESSFSLKPRTGDVLEIATDDQTVFQVPGVKDATLDDLQVGAYALVSVQDEGGTLTALRVVMQRPQLRRGRVAGQITEIGETQADGTTNLNVQTRDGVKTVQVTGETIYRIPRDKNPGLDDLAIGQTIMATGEWLDADTLKAEAIGVIPVKLTEEDGQL